MAVVGNENCRNWIGGVIGVRAAGGGVDHVFGVAVVRSNEPSSAAGLEGLVEAGKSGVHLLHGLDCCLEDSPMPDPVGIGINHDDGVEVAFLNRFHHGIGDSRSRHFRLQVVGGDFR